MHKPFVQFFFFFCCKIFICQVNNFVLDLELFAKTKALKTLTTIERLKGIHFIFGFTAVPCARLNVSCRIDAYSRLYLMFNIGARHRICYNLCEKQKYFQVFLHI